MNYDDTDVDLSITREELSKKTARDLYKISKAIKVKNYTHFRKPELLVLAEEHPAAGSMLIKMRHKEL